MKIVVAVLLLLSMFASCTSKKADEEGARQHATDTRVLEELQGVWLDDNTEAPLFKIEGDSIYYAGQNNVPQQFALFNDTLFIYGVQRYAILYADVRSTAFILLLRRATWYRCINRKSTRCMWIHNRKFINRSRR